MTTLVELIWLPPLKYWGLNACSLDYIKDCYEQNHSPVSVIETGCKSFLDDSLHWDIHIECDGLYRTSRWMPWKNAGLLILVNGNRPGTQKEIKQYISTYAESPSGYNDYGDLPFDVTRPHLLMCEAWVWQHGDCFASSYENPGRKQVIIQKIHSARRLSMHEIIYYRILWMLKVLS